jgi:hypothetical protein
MEKSGLGLNIPLGKIALNLEINELKSSNNSDGKSNPGFGICTGDDTVPKPGTVGGGPGVTLI